MFNGGDISKLTYLQWWGTWYYW